MIKSLCLELVDLFEQNKNDERALKMKKYMKDRYSFFGIPSPLRKELMKNSDLWRMKWTNIQLKQVKELLWADPRREMQYVAIDIAIKRKKVLTVDDLKWIESLIVNKSWWDTVDALASHFVGYILELDEILRAKTNKRWINSDNMWLIRTAIIFQLKYKQKVDKELLFNNILKHKDSKEFFINKASGWALRELAKTEADTVRQFVGAHPELSNLTKREAMKHLL